MTYYFNELDPVSFQRLINAVLVNRFGEDVRVTNIRGADGGRDAETAPLNPYFEFVANQTESSTSQIIPPRPGRYLFQVKHHRTVDTPSSEARAAVLNDFETEVQKNVLARRGVERVNYFFLITNVSSSREALARLDEKRSRILKTHNVHCDVWWQDQLAAYLDQMPFVWSSFPQLFSGGQPPFLAELYSPTPHGLSRALRLALDNEYRRDIKIRFRQIDLETDLSKLFVNLDVAIGHLAPRPTEGRLLEEGLAAEGVESNIYAEEVDSLGRRYLRRRYSALSVLLNESGRIPPKIILEGGPGQGKSTITQMVAQIYREQVLRKEDIEPEGRWKTPKKVRIPFRVELRSFAEWMSKDPESSVEEYLALTLRANSGGAQITVDDIHNVVQSSPILLIFDGVDEIGSDDLRDQGLLRIVECVNRFENNLKSDLRVILTTRPPAIAGRTQRLVDFRRLPILPMEPRRVDNYLERWLSVQVPDSDERDRVSSSFGRRRQEPHVQALIKNPMQLSVLLHFIRLKGEAFPDRRAELYRDYFQIVIDRDVEKSPELLKHRALIEALHEFFGYKIHVLTEAEQADGTLARADLLRMAEWWLTARGNEPEMATTLFRIGEERLGLIVTLKGEGDEARYGYEIQPVREYFAAAYINNQIRGNAHDVFTTMVRRSFWREVAVFLAGLRRPNEKADLIARARQLDDDPVFGWRQDGRSITLQLLAEGVYSEPKHVFTEALNYVLELLDPRAVPVQIELKDFLTILPPLISQDSSGRAAASISDLLRQNDTSLSDLELFRLYKLAFVILDKVEIASLIMDFKPIVPDFLGKVRLFWPLSVGVDIHEAAQKPEFWGDSSQRDLAYWLWLSALSSDAATGLPVPVSYHHLLVENYASLPASTFLLRSPTEKGLPYTKVFGNWAVWKLLAYQRLASIFSMRGAYIVDDGEGVMESIKAAFDELEKNNGHTSFEGLDKTTRDVVSQLIKASRKVVAILLRGNPGGEVLRSLSTYAESFLGYLSSGGIMSWLTCRCTGILLSGGISGGSYPLNDIEKAIKRQPELRDSPKVRDKLLQLWKGVEEFYVESKASGDSDWSRCIDEVPDKLRLEPDGELIRWQDFMVKHVIQGDNLPFEWLENAAYDSAGMRTVVEGGRDNLLKVLAWAQTAKNARKYFGRPLLARDVQRIMKIARNSDNANILIGASKCVSTSKFVRVAGTELLLKMITTDKADESEISSVFNSNARTETGEAQNATREILEQAANRIIGEPEAYSFDVRSSAANYLFEHQTVKLPPMLEMEEELDIAT